MIFEIIDLKVNNILSSDEEFAEQKELQTFKDINKFAKILKIKKLK